MNLRENWRVVMLVLFVVLSAVALFVPLGGGGAAGNGPAAARSGPTQLSYGLELSGGTRIRAPLEGVTAEDVSFDPSNEAQLERDIANELNVAQIDVQVRPQSQQGGTVEVFAPNVTQEEFRAALNAVGLDVSADQVRSGVTDETLQTAETVLDNKINTAGLSGGDASIVRSATGEAFILVEVPGQSRQEVLDLIGERGTVLIVAHFPKENGEGYRNVPLLTQGDLADVGTVQTDQRTGEPFVPITLNQQTAENFSNAMVNFGFTSQEGVNNCRYQSNPDDAGYCLYTVSNGRVVNDEIVEGRVVSAAAMSPGLAGTFESGDFVRDPAFRITSGTQQEAQDLRLNLVAGALPASLDIDSGTTYFLEPSLASEFKLFSLITGFIAVLAVAGAVFVRYRRPEVALPMLATATAEVFILLGFAALVGLALDLSHIAGFIAVIGTGVDDLVIIADEILQSGDVKTGKVFRSRFRKAFWVIGAAAATTIIAMSPLAVLSLGDLQGFAIVTIVGVLIGVLITRPAYGDILRNLVLD